MAKPKTKPLTNAERQRRYREKRNLDPQLREAYLQSKHDKYEKDKKAGKRKLVKDMTKREHRIEKKAWKKRYHSSQKKKMKETLLSVEESPLSSPCSQRSSVDLSRQKVTSLSMKAKENKSLKEQIAELNARLKKSETKVRSLKKHIYRSGKRTGNCTTPRSKTKKLLQMDNIRVNARSSAVKRTLEFHYAVMGEISEQPQAKKRKTVASLLAGKVIKRYKFKKRFTSEVKVAGARNIRYRKMGSLMKRLKPAVQRFFLRNDNSKLCPGKKDTITRHQVKKQRRYLTGTLSTLYRKFISECTNCDLASFSTFWRLKPFWVLPPREKDRQTCLCTSCENVRLMCVSLYRAGALDTSDIDTIVKNVSCDVNNKDCMYGECVECKERTLHRPFQDCENKYITFQTWEKVKEKRVFKDGKEKLVQISRKFAHTKELSSAWEFFHHLLHAYKKHVFNMANQFKHYRNIREELTEEEAIIHVDFSENYVCKWDTEIQSAHFGASKKQLSLHTGYLKAGKNKIASFCGVSDSLEHDPFPIWAYLDPILEKIKQQYPSVQKIHFFSDGPTPQYRQKNNFYLLSSIPLQKGFTCSWNFFEAGHGKGIPDGIGATVKRAADRAVLFGSSITDAKSFIDIASKQCPSVHVYGIDGEEIQAMRKAFPVNGITTVPGTMALHQILCLKKHRILHRHISCVCVRGKECCESNLFTEFSFRGGESDGESVDGDWFTQEECQQQPVGDEKGKYVAFLSALRKCETFPELLHECESQMLNTQTINGTGRNVLDTRLKIDTTASNDVPCDIPSQKSACHLFPVKVRADGDCLPGCGSVFAYGKDDCSEEMRVRIIHELATNAELYLDDNFLSRGLLSVDYSCSKLYASYSDFYVPGKHNLDDKTVVRQLFEKEVLELCKAKSYMGIWQVFGLANVLKMSILSVFPEGTNPNIRKHIHRRIEPKVKTTDSEAIILWTSTRESRKSLYWCPNHFVPVLPYRAK